MPPISSSVRRPGWPRGSDLALQGGQPSLRGNRPGPPGQKTTGKDSENHAGQQRHPQGHREFGDKEADGRSAPVLQHEDHGDQQQRSARYLAGTEG